MLCPIIIEYSNRLLRLVQVFQIIGWRIVTPPRGKSAEEPIVMLALRNDTMISTMRQARFLT